MSTAKIWLDMGWEAWNYINCSLKALHHQTGPQCTVIVHISGSAVKINPQNSFPPGHSLLNLCDSHLLPPFLLPLFFPTAIYHS